MRQRQQGWQYHAVVRRHMIHYLRHRSDDSYRRLHARLAEYYATKCDRLKWPVKECWCNERWQRAKLEYAYHHLMSAPDAHWADYLSLFIIAFRKQRAFAQELAEWLLEPATYDELSKSQRKDVQLFVKQLEAVDEGSWKDGRLMYERLCTVQGLSTQAKAYALTFRGIGHRSQERFSDALADFNRAMELSPDDAYTIGNRGYTYRLMNRYEEALKDFNCALELDPNYLWGLNRRGQTYDQLRRYEEALADFNHAIKLNPDYIFAIGSRGETYRRMGCYQKALADFNRVIKLKPNAWAMAYRGQTYRALKSYNKALTDFNHALQINPRYAWALARRGEIYQRMGRYEDALTDFKRAIDIKPDGYIILYDIAVTIARWKGIAEAQAEIDAARSALLAMLETKRAFALYGLGGLAALTGDSELALNHLQEAISLDRETVEWANHDIAWQDFRAEARFQTLLSRNENLIHLT